MRNKDRDKELFGINLQKVTAPNEQWLHDFNAAFVDEYQYLINMGVDLRDVYNREIDFAINAKIPFRLFKLYEGLESRRLIRILQINEDKMIVKDEKTGEKHEVRVYSDKYGEHFKLFDEYYTSYGDPSTMDYDEEDDDDTER